MFWNVLSDLADQYMSFWQVREMIHVCVKKIVKEHYFTFVRLEM